MDTIDTAILNCLKENGRATSSEISKKVRLSVPAVAERIRKLEQNSIIQKYTVKLDRKQTGQNLLAFVFVNIDKTEHIDAFRRQITALPCVLECHHLAGTYDYLLKVSVSDTAALESFLTNMLKKIDGVNSSNTFITLTTLKEELNC
ncbi:Lrp/AsnC family transcriptional regulator [uncultured Phascolarctobacterium sp.]|uniref:Lrp/AsnC family transcriptional regulator n=1 Tax=uncultured Phascolarctobacterium sp. TaxID=512296 RepID=UPI0026221AD0|nr:Lrp/AsnC family transcriptional regulator [uncultured Phascolarctobacterium sp.]